MALEIVGSSLPRRDARDKVMGTALYTYGLELPGMLHAKVLRSPHPHARVLAVNASRAEALPGVRCVLTRDDFLGNDKVFPYYGPAFKDQPILALDKVRYAGDVVAAVAAVDPETAAEALELIEVEYEELPAVFDLEEAMRSGAPLIHERITLGGDYADLVDLHPLPGTNCCNHFHWERGNVERGFAQADETFEDTFSNAPTQHCAMEPHTALAAVDEQGKITVWSATQTPFVVRTQLSEIFKVPVTKVRLIVPYLGGGFGSKTYPKLEPLVAALALKARSPVRLVLSREEVFLTARKQATIVRLKSGVKRDGTLVARECHVLWDCGAYADISPRVSKKSGYTAAGPYDIPNVKIDSYCVYTNLPPASAFRGFGVDQLAWAYESHMDIIARKLGLNPVDFRMKNLIDEGTIFVTGEELYSIGIKESLRKVWQALGPPGPKVAEGIRVRGRGVACSIKSTLTPSLSQAQVRLNEDGSLQIIASTVEMGQGSETVLCQIAAEALGAPLEAISITHPDTDSTPYDLTTSSSRSTFHMGKAIQRATLEVKEELLQLAAELLEANPADLETRQGQVSVKGSDRSVSFAQALGKRFGMKGGHLQAEATIHTGGIQKTREGEAKITSPFWFVGAAAAEVEVDPETGQVRLLQLVTSTDLGQAINLMTSEGQMEGGSVQGIGQALSEEMVFDAGQTVNPTLMDYRIPSMRDIPERLDTAFVTVPHPDGPYGAKGIGETSIIPVPPAIANAIADAVGVRIREIPITPEKVLRALREQGEEKEERP